MDIKKFAPWNWFKKEDEETGSVIPVQATMIGLPAPESISTAQSLQLIGRLTGFSRMPFETSVPRHSGLTCLYPIVTSGLLKPNVDSGHRERIYN